MRISVIVAKSTSNVIGVNNSLPWKLRDDLLNFKKITSGHHILMGRKTFDSLGKPLPNRVHLVISTKPQTNTHNVLWFTSIFKAIKYAKKHNEKELFIIGGQQIFESTLTLADRIYLSSVLAPDLQGDAFFPPLHNKNWETLSTKLFSKSEHNEYPFEFTILDRK